MTTNFIFELPMRVRDYECDLQGIVNNAVYQHYTEHCRNEFMRQRLIGLETLHERGIDTVVARVEINFKSPLRPGDNFVVRLALEKEGIKYVFTQDIFRHADQKLCARAKTTVVCLVNGRLGQCPELDTLLPQPQNADAN